MDTYGKSTPDNTLTLEKLERVTRPLIRARKQFEAQLTGLYVNMRLCGFTHNQIRTRFIQSGASVADLRLVDSLKERWETVEDKAGVRFSDRD